MIFAFDYIKFIVKNAEAL